MGGKEASRGFLYQAFASVLEAMCQENWNKIYIEFESDNNKVDIALEENSKVFKHALQDGFFVIKTAKGLQNRHTICSLFLASASGTSNIVLAYRW